MLKKVFKWLSTILLIILVAFVGILFVPRAVGLKPMAVLSGSMEPTYHVGSLIFVKEVSPETIKAGDPMTYRIGTDTVVTHRVVEVDEENKSFRTKGDANNTEDGGTVAFTDVIGKPVFSVPYMGYVTAQAGTKSGTIVVITIIVVILLLTFLPDLLAKDEEKKGDQS